MRRPGIRRSLLALAVGIVTGLAALVGTGAPTTSSSRGDCFGRLRLLRHAIASFESQHGRLPGLDAGPLAAGHVGQEPSARLLIDQITQPRDARGWPSPQGPFPGLIDAVPVNPFTGSNALVVVPVGVDAVAFAAASRAGWAYLAEPGHDALGPLPAGLVLPCGSDAGPGSRPPAQDLAFEIEDFLRWR